MAKQDWKKTGERPNSISWGNKKTDEVASVNWVANHPKGFPFAFSVEGKTVKDFKNKQQAIAYANAYMRTH